MVTFEVIQPPFMAAHDKNQSEKRGKELFLSTTIPYDQDSLLLAWFGSWDFVHAHHLQLNLEYFTSTAIIRCEQHFFDLFSVIRVIASSDLGQKPCSFHKQQAVLQWLAKMLLELPLPSWQIHAYIQMNWAN